MSLIRNASNRLIGVALVGRDITARKLAEREREELLAAEQPRGPSRNGPAASRTSSWPPCRTSCELR